MFQLILGWQCRTAGLPSVWLFLPTGHKESGWQAERGTIHILVEQARSYESHSVTQEGTGLDCLMVRTMWAISISYKLSEYYLCWYIIISKERDTERQGRLTFLWSNNSGSNGVPLIPESPFRTSVLSVRNSWQHSDRKTMHCSPLLPYFVSDGLTTHSITFPIEGCTAVLQVIKRQTTNFLQLFWHIGNSKQQFNMKNLAFAHKQSFILHIFIL